jgi:hypothetical protein
MFDDMFEVARESCSWLTLLSAMMMSYQLWLANSAVASSGSVHLGLSVTESDADRPRSRISEVNAYSRNES